MKEEEEGEEFQTYKQLEKLWQPLLLNVLYHYTVLSSSETGWRAKDMYYDKAEKRRTNKNVLLWLRTECLFSPNPGLMSLSLQISSPWLFFSFLSLSLLHSIFCFFMFSILSLLLTVSHLFSHLKSCLSWFLVCNLSKKEYGPHVIIPISNTFPGRMVCVMVYVWVCICPGQKFKR